MKSRPDIKTSATLSPCGVYRYDLTREWDAARPKMLVILTNPSIADAEIEDPTSTRLIVRIMEKMPMFGGYVLVNLFALRSTDPKALRNHHDPIGFGNDYAIMNALDRTEGFVLCGWGVPGNMNGRGEAVRKMVGNVRNLSHLGLTKDGHPKHPLYIGYKIDPVPWR